MKKLLYLFSAFILLSACDYNVTEFYPYDERDAFLGRYEAEEFRETFGLVSFFDVRILRDNEYNSPYIYIRNFYGIGGEVFAEVRGNHIEIPRQRIGDYIIQGTGRLEYRDVVLTYVVTNVFPGNGYTEFCNTRFYRR